MTDCRTVHRRPKPDPEGGGIRPLPNTPIRKPRTTRTAHGVRGTQGTDDRHWGPDHTVTSSRGPDRPAPA